MDLTTGNKPDLQDIGQRADRFLKESTIASYEAIGAALAHETDTQQARNDFKNVVRLAKEAGVSYDEIVDFAGQVKINKSYTWHPTEGLNQEGVQLGLNLMEAYGAPEAIRPQAVMLAEQAIREAQDITPAQKDSMINEIKANVPIAGRDNAGANATERFFEEVIEEEYGARPDLCMNLGGRTWIFDADGKNNNEGWAMLSALTTLKMAAFQQTIDALDHDFIEYDVDLMTLRDDLRDVMENLKKLNEKSTRIVEDLDALPVEERPGYYRAHYDELQDAKEDLRSLYQVVGDKDARGHNFYKNTLKLLDAHRKNTGLDEQAAFEVDEAFRTLRRNGFMYEKGQTRHNGIVYRDEINDDLFAHEPFLQSEFLRPEDVALIRSVEHFSELNPNQQQMIRAYVTKDTESLAIRRKLQKFLNDANPLEFDPKNGYPTSPRALLDRTMIRAICKRNFAEGIISDAGPFSASEEHFLAKIHAMPGMKHMMLNEDQETLSMQAKLAIIFNDNGGAEGAEFRHNNLDLVYRRGPDDEIRIMIPSSDSMRNGGPGTLLQMCNTIREATLAGIQMGRPVEIMLGSGGSMGRFGCDQAMVRRIVAQTLQEYAADRGYDFNPQDPKDAAALRMAMVVMHTEQGRMPRYLSATVDQIANTNISRMTEMLEDRLELTGLVERGTFIDQRPPIKPAMVEKTDRRWREMIEEFSDFRFAVSDHQISAKGGPEHILNSVARKVMCPNMRPYMNNGARPAAKGGGKEVLDVRAIENDQAKAVGQFFDSSFFAVGGALAELHRTANSNESSQDRNITRQDVRALINQPDWNFFIFGKGVTEAMRFRATRSFDKLSSGGEWDFDRAVEVGKSVRFEKLNPDDEKSPCRMLFDNQNGTVSEEEAYMAKIYFDRLQFLALTEATLDNKLHHDLDDIMRALRPADGGLEFGPGDKTLQEWAVAKTVYDLHRKNDDALDLIYELEDHFEQGLAEGKTKEQIVEELGGEAMLRKAASAWRAGTLAHVPFWTGQYNYGIENRTKARLTLSNDNGYDPEPEPGDNYDRQAA